MKFKPDVLGMYDPDKLQYAPWNPKQRIDATDKAFQTLVDSIRAYGQFMPAIINEHGLVIDGNRRVAACKILGKPVEAVVKDKVDAFKIYEVVNNCRLAIKGNQVAEIFTNEPRALSSIQTRAISGLLDKFGGIEYLNSFLDKPKRSLNQAKIVISFCRWLRTYNDPARLNTVVAWIDRHKLPICPLTGLRSQPGWILDGKTSGNITSKIKEESYLYVDSLIKKDSIPLLPSELWRFGGITFEWLCTTLIKSSPIDPELKKAIKHASAMATRWPYYYTGLSGDFMNKVGKASTMHRGFCRAEKEYNSVGKAL